MSLQGYARTYADFWTGSVAGLDDCSRSLAHFLFSSQNVSPFGLYYKPARTMAHEFRRTEAQVRVALGKLCAVEFCQYDDASGFVWVREMAAWQLRPLPLKPNNLLIKSARRWYSHLPRNPFLGPFFDRYNVDLHLGDPDAFRGTEVERRDWIARPEPAPLPLPVIAPPPDGIDRRVEVCGDAEFEIWWKAYPKERHEGKKPCAEKWRRARIPLAQLPTMIAKLEDQKRSHGWRKDGGKFIPLPLTYINQERWNDHVRDQRVTDTLNKTNQGTLDTLEDLMNEDES